MFRSLHRPRYWPKQVGDDDDDWEWWQSLQRPKKVDIRFFSPRGSEVSFLGLDLPRDREAVDRKDLAGSFNNCSLNLPRYQAAYAGKITKNLARRFSSKSALWDLLKRNNWAFFEVKTSRLLPSDALRWCNSVKFLQEVAFNTHWKHSVKSLFSDDDAMMMMMSSFEFEEGGGHQRKLRAESFWPASVWFLYQRGVVNHNNVMRWTLLNQWYIINMILRDILTPRIRYSSSCSSCSVTEKPG